MPQASFSSRGIIEWGTYTGALPTGPFVETSFGNTTPAGASFKQSMKTVEQYNGQQAAAVESGVDTIDGMLEINSTNAALDKLRIFMGLPSSTLTGDLTGGTPTDEVLRVKSNLIGTVEIPLYIKTAGKVGARTYRFPRCKVAQLPDQNASRSAYNEPKPTFRVLADAADDFYQITDPKT